MEFEIFEKFFDEYVYLNRYETFSYSLKAATQSCFFVIKNCKERMIDEKRCMSNV